MKLLVSIARIMRHFFLGCGKAASQNGALHSLEHPDGCGASGLVRGGVL